MISVENMNAKRPTITEFDSSASKTLMPTFPHRMVVSKTLESFLDRATLIAWGLLFLDSISNRSLETLKKQD